MRRVAPAVIASVFAACLAAGPVSAHATPGVSVEECEPSHVYVTGCREIRADTPAGSVSNRCETWRHTHYWSGEDCSYAVNDDELLACSSHSSSGPAGGSSSSRECALAGPTGAVTCAVRTYGIGCSPGAAPAAGVPWCDSVSARPDAPNTVAVECAGSEQRCEPTAAEGPVCRFAAGPVTATCENHQGWRFTRQGCIVDSEQASVQCGDHLDRYYPETSLTGCRARFHHEGGTCTAEVGDPRTEISGACLPSSERAGHSPVRRP